MDTNSGALAHGAFMTYASLDSGNATAPGQISVWDMTDIYRVKELDEDTGVYGIIGGNTSYSVSPFMHNAAFKSEGINSVFVPLQVGDLDEFMRRMVKPESREVELNFKGFSVTNPHKQSIIRHLDFVDETATRIGAVNTVKIEDGKFCGYNTDAPGFIEPLKNLFGELKDARVAVFGAGGAARACIYALKQHGADVFLFARDPQKARSISDEFDVPLHRLAADNVPLAFDIIVNATPLGTVGIFENETIATAEQLRGVKLVYDLIYNPSETRLMHEANSVNVSTIGGLEMLVAQGSRQFRIWTGLEAPLQAMSDGVRKKTRSIKKDCMEAEALNCPNCGGAVASDKTQCEFCKSRLKTVGCNSCLGLMFLGSAFCGHCGKKAVAAEVFPNDEAGKCPRCEIDLQAVQIDATTIRECTRCGGLWSGIEAFEDLCANKEQQAAILNFIGNGSER